MSSAIDKKPCGRAIVPCCLLVMLSIGLFVASLFQDGFYIARDNPRAWAPCIGLLLIGWIAVFDGVWAWLANPLLVIAWMLMFPRPTRRIAVGCAALSLGLSLSFQLHRNIMTDEGGGRSLITGYGLGYWLWIGSIAVALVGSIVGVLLSPTREEKAVGDR